MFCSKCGSQVAEGTAFCGACGQPTGGVPHAAAPPTVAVGGAGGSTVAVYGSPGAASPHAPAAAPVVLPSPYAGFWLRLLAYLIDGIVIGVVFGIFALMVVAIVGIGYFRTMLEGMNGEDATIPAAFISIIVLVATLSLVANWLYYGWMESSQYQGTLGKMALGLTVTDLSRTTGHVCACQRQIFCEVNHRNDSAGHRLHHGGIHGKETGAARHDCELPGPQENLKLRALRRPSRSARDEPARHAVPRECDRRIPSCAGRARPSP